MASGETRGPDDTGTQGEAYTARLVEREGAWWKRVLNVQAPYQWNLRRYDLGTTLDVGCGLGRNLVSLPAGSVGVDHNAQSVQVARERGFTAATVEEFHAGPLARQEGYDALLFAHIVEHVPEEAAEGLVNEYLPYLRRGGKVLFICPQERGYASDPTHVAWTTGDDLQSLARAVGLEPVSNKSFPFPRAVGKVFLYNEFNVLATKP